MKYKVSFDTVALEDAKIFAKAKTKEDLQQAMIEYDALLNACGWTKQEYEMILLTRVNGQWD